MNSQQVQSFLTVCDTLNYSRAAKQLHMSQSVVSRQIAQLEEELGFLLFARSNRSVRMTKSGEILRSFFTETGRTWQAAYARALRVADATAYDISVHLIDMLDNTSMIRAISSFSGCSFHLEKCQSPCTAEQLLSGRFDVGTTYEHEVAGQPRIRYRELFRGQDYLICAERYAPPRGHAPVLFMVSDDMQTAANFPEERAASLGLEQYQLKLLPNLASVLTAVESGLGYTVFKDFSFPFLRFPYKKTRCGISQSTGLTWIVDPDRPHIERFVDAFFRQFEQERAGDA